MERDLMTKIIKEELERIPKDSAGSAQNELRMVYKMRRQHDLSRDPESPRTETFRKAVEHVRKNHPQFAPQCDREYFGWSA